MKRLALFIGCALFCTLGAATQTQQDIYEGDVWLCEHMTMVRDFPKPGVAFLNYGPLLRNPQAFQQAIHQMAENLCEEEVDIILGLDARGFVFGVALALELNKPFVMVRKAGKLPGATEKVEYALEYGHATLEIEADALAPGQKVLIVDDVVATGGTARAAAQLAENAGATVVGITCLIELSPLNPRAILSYPLFSLLRLFPADY